MVLTCCHLSLYGSDRSGIQRWKGGGINSEEKNPEGGALRQRVKQKNVGQRLSIACTYTLAHLSSETEKNHKCVVNVLKERIYTKSATSRDPGVRKF